MEVLNNTPFLLPLWGTRVSSVSPAPPEPSFSLRRWPQVRHETHALGTPKAQVAMLLPSSSTLDFHSLTNTTFTSLENSIKRVLSVLDTSFQCVFSTFLSLSRHFFRFSQVISGSFERISFTTSYFLLGFVGHASSGLHLQRPVPPAPSHFYLHGLCGNSLESLSFYISSAHWFQSLLGSYMLL